MRRFFIEEAILNANKSRLHRSNHGAIIIYRGKIIGRGFNKICVENINNINRFSVHAEVDAIQNALRKISFTQLKYCTLVVVRVEKEGNTLNSKPCKYCTNFIKKCQISQCFYSSD